MRAIKGTELRGRKRIAVRLLDLVTLLHNVHEGARYPEVGFEDARETLQSLSRKLGGATKVDPGALESALWSCNLMSESGRFWDSQGRTWDEFLRDVLGSPAKFNKQLNLIKDEE